MKNNDSLQIYVYLLGEGTDVWRPVTATRIKENVFRIVENNSNPEDEQWQFNYGDLVRCKERLFSENETRLAAYEKVSRKTSN